jgi:bifunctional polynucleotide phosphatase/kinase
MKDYIRINRDTLKTKEKCWAKTEESMKEKKFIVIDNTNPGKDDRKPYIELAKKYSNKSLL